MTRQVVYGETDVDVSVQRITEDIMIVPYTVEELSSLKFSVPIPAGVIVTKVAHQVTEAFSGGTPAVVIGDGTTANLFMTTGTVTPGTVNNFVFGSGSKVYTAAGVVTVTHAASIADGAGKLFIYIVDPTGNWRVPSL